MENKNELAVVQPEETKLNIFGSVAGFEAGQRMAKVFAMSNLVPVQYQNNVGNCLIGLNIATRMGADPLMVFQNLVVVHNQPTFEAKFAIACFNATGKYTPIRYEEIGKRGTDSYGMYAYAIDKSTGDVLKGPEITIGLAKLEGWYNQNPKWRNIPQLMLRYRAASWFIRTTDPGVMLGFQTREEVEDASYEEIPAHDDPVPQGKANVEIIDIDTLGQTDESQNADNTAETTNGATDDKLSNDDENSRQSAKKTAKDKEDPKGADSQKEVKPIGAQPTPELFKD